MKIVSETGLLRQVVIHPALDALRVVGKGIDILRKQKTGVIIIKSFVEFGSKILVLGRGFKFSNNFFQ